MRTARARKPRKTKPAGETFGGILLDRLASAISPAALARADRDSMRDRILARVEDLPPPNTSTVRLSEGQWITTAPGVELKILRIDRKNNNQTVMFRLQPGAVIVPHRHTQEEECLVLEGEVFVGRHRVGTGDMHIAMPGARHPPIRAPRGALLCIRSEIPPEHFRIA